MSGGAEESFVKSLLIDTDWQAAIFATLFSSIINLGILYWKLKESKKETISSLIEEVVDLSVMHWCSSTTDNESFRNSCITIQKKVDDVRWKIEKRSLKIVQFFCWLLSKILRREIQINKMRKKTESIFIQFRREITGGKFSDFDKPPYLFESKKIKKIKEVTRNLRRRLKIERHH